MLAPAHEHAVAGLFVAAGPQTLSNLGMTSRRREEIELELHRTESRFRAPVQQSQDVVSVVDRDGTITYLSPAAARLTTRKVPNLHGRRLVDLLPPRAYTVLNAAMVRTAGAGKGSIEEVEIMIRAGAEHARWLEVVVTSWTTPPSAGSCSTPPTSPNAAVTGNSSSTRPPTTR